MNKQDRILIVSLLILSVIGIFLLSIKKEKSEVAYVYRKNKLVLEVPLEKEQHKYQVEGKLGTVDITVKDYGIMVEKETSPKHLCSKQGYIKKSYETIVCLPNEIVVKISSSNELDTVVT